MFDRFEKMVGKTNLENIKQKKVIVVGLGGVGGHVVLGLIRSGISNITLVDYDRVDITNLNRQVVAKRSTIGNKKTKALKDLILDINPECHVELIDTFLDQSNINQIITNNYDYVIDACDTISTKKEIVKTCIEKKIKLISSMGTGNKLDPSKLEITDIRKTINDPLARIMRKWVKDEKINDKITVLSSTEVPIKVKNIVTSNSFVPGSAGLLIASWIINDIIDRKDINGSTTQ